MPTTLRNTDILFNDGTTQSTAAVRGTNFVMYASTTTWVCPTSVTSVVIYCFGGGGGAGQNFGRDGGYGGYADGTYTVTPGTTYTVTIGAGGASGNPAGSAGGESWFGVNSSSKLISATGGAGGPNSATNAANGTGSSGTTKTGVNINQRTLFLGTQDRLLAPTSNPAVAYSTSSIYVPGARGAKNASGCCVFFAGGVGGAIFLLY